MTKRLKFSVKNEVHYCVPLWLRDQHVELAIARARAGTIGRIEPMHEARPERIAVVGYGPSLNDTWEQVKDFPFVMTCSGSHRFLIDRGIIPTWHIEVDPREHKIPLLGTPHPDVTYLPASAVHPKYFDHLEAAKAKVQLWHVFESSAEGLRTLPAGEWALTGGADVGLRAIVMAAFLGFRDLHVFGLDGREGASGKHAALHPNQPKGSAEVEYDGVVYRTTIGMLECAKMLPHELDMLGSKVKTTFYGEGLVQHIAKNRIPKPQALPRGLVTGIAASKEELISAEYRQLNAQLHRENFAYGVGGEKHAPTVLKLCDSLKTRNVLDYGCGKGRLAKALPFGICEYDPAIPGKDDSPRPADLVICSDVLEHVEPERLGYVLDDLRRCTRQVGYFVIHTGPAQKTLPDGRNTHLIQHGKDWWEKRLRKFFTVGRIMQQGPELHVVVGPKTITQKAVA